MALAGAVAVFAVAEGFVAAGPNGALNDQEFLAWQGRLKGFNGEL